MLVPTKYHIYHTLAAIVGSLVVDNIVSIALPDIGSVSFYGHRLLANVFVVTMLRGVVAFATSENGP